MDAIGLKMPFKKQSNPIPWIDSWLNSDYVQNAPQETEISSYLVGQIDSKLSNQEFKKFKL